MVLVLAITLFAWSKSRAPATAHGRNCAHGGTRLLVAEEEEHRPHRARAEAEAAREGLAAKKE